MLLREALSSNNTAFAKLVRRGQPDLAEFPESLQVNGGEDRSYRMYRKFSEADLKELRTLYEAGVSMPKLAEKFECHRQTVARQLKKAAVELRVQQLRTPEFDVRARALYEQGHSLDEVADLLGVQASTINRAVRAAGGTLRPQRGQSRDD